MKKRRKIFAIDYSFFNIHNIHHEMYPSDSFLLLLLLFLFILLRPYRLPFTRCIKFRLGNIYTAYCKRLLFYFDRKGREISSFFVELVLSVLQRKDLLAFLYGFVVTLSVLYILSKWGLYTGDDINGKNNRKIQNPKRK